MKLLYVFISTFKRSWFEIKRYWLNTISSIISIIIIFYVISLGFKYVGSNMNLGNSLQTTAIGYFTWTAILFSITDFSWTIMNEMNRGLIEQVFLSPFGPLTVYSFMQLSNMILMIPLMYIILIVVFKMASLSIIVPISFFIILMLLLIQSYGIGMILAGITLRFKRTQALLQITQFAIIGLLIFKTKSNLLKMLIPITQYFEAFYKILNNINISVNEWFMMLGASMIYFSLGALIFALFIKAVKINGELSTY